MPKSLDEAAKELAQWEITRRRIDDELDAGWAAALGFGNRSEVRYSEQFTEGLAAFIRNHSVAINSYVYELEQERYDAQRIFEYHAGKVDRAFDGIKKEIVTRADLQVLLDVLNYSTIPGVAVYSPDEAPQLQKAVIDLQSLVSLLTPSRGNGY